MTHKQLKDLIKECLHDVLNEEPTKAACAWCQKELNIKSSPNESHGLCKRHFIEQMKTLKKTDAQIQAYVDKKEKEGFSFCPDLKTNENYDINELVADTLNEVDWKKHIKELLDMEESITEAVVHTISKPVKDTNTGEWVVKWMTNGKRDEDKTYYTDDLKDAQDTAKHLQQRAAELNSKSSATEECMDEGNKAHVDKESQKALKYAQKFLGCIVTSRNGKDMVAPPKHIQDKFDWRFKQYTHHEVANSYQPLVAYLSHVFGVKKRDMSDAINNWVPLSKASVQEVRHHQ